DVDLGDDLERPALGERDAELGERLQAAADPRLLAPDALRDRLDLAEARRDEGEDAVSLAVVEARQDDRIRDGTAGRRPPGTVHREPQPGRRQPRCRHAPRRITLACRPCVRADATRYLDSAR